MPNQDLDRALKGAKVGLQVGLVLVVLPLTLAFLAFAWVVLSA